MPTAMATTMSRGGSLDDTTRNTTSSATPDHSTRRHCWDSQGPAMMTSATAAAMSREVAMAGSVSSTTRSVAGSTAAMTPCEAEELGQPGHGQARHGPGEQRRGLAGQRRTRSTTTATTGTTPAKITTRPVSASAKRSGDPLVDVDQVLLGAADGVAQPRGHEHPDTHQHQEKMSRTTSACERTQWRGETDTTTPATTPTCSFSSSGTPARRPHLCSAQRSSSHDGNPLPMTVPWPGAVRCPSRPETFTGSSAAGHLAATGRSGPVRSVAAMTGGAHQGRVTRRVIASAAGTAMADDLLGLPGAPPTPAAAAVAEAMPIVLVVMACSTHRRARPAHRPLSPPLIAGPGRARLRCCGPTRRRPAGPEP